MGLDDLAGTDHAKGGVELQQRDEALEVVPVRRCVEDEVERALEFCEIRSWLVDDHGFGAEAPRVIDLSAGGGEHGDLGAHGSGDLHGHVPETTHPDDADLLPRPDAPPTQGRIDRDPRAHHRPRFGEIDHLGNVDDEVLVHDVEGRVAPLGHRAVSVLGSIGEHVAVLAILLHPGLAGSAVAAGVHHASDADPRA